MFKISIKWNICDCLHHPSPLAPFFRCGADGSWENIAQCRVRFNWRGRINTLIKFRVALRMQCDGPFFINEFLFRCRHCRCGHLWRTHYTIGIRGECQTFVIYRRIFWNGERQSKTSAAISNSFRRTFVFNLIDSANWSSHAGASLKSHDQQWSQSTANNFPAVFHLPKCCTIRWKLWSRISNRSRISIIINE